MFNVVATMKVGLAAIILGALLTGCSHERTPYTAAEITNNPPRIEPAFTNPVPVPTSERTNSRVYPSDAASQPK